MRRYVAVYVALVMATVWFCGMGCAAKGGGLTDAVSGSADVADVRPGDAKSAEVGAEAVCRLESGGEVGTEATVALFGLEQPAMLPMPFDLFTVAAPASPTGRVVKLGPENSVLLDAGLGFMMSAEAMLDLVNGLDGFGRYAPIVIAFSGPLDKARFDLEPEEYRYSDSPIFLVALEADGSCGQPEPILVTTEDTEGPDGPLTLVIATPFLPLKPATRYALVVTRELLDEAGLPVFPDGHFRHVTGCSGAPPDGQDDSAARAAELLLPLETCLQGLVQPMCLCDLAVATVFTTRDSAHALRTIREFLESPDAPPLNLSLDLDLDGETDVFEPSALPYLPDDVTDEDLETNSIALRGAFDAPDFRGDNLDVRIEYGQPPEVHGTIRIPFVLMLPAAPEMQPFKVVVMGHGHSGFKERIGYLAREFGDAGLALSSIDAIGHGELEGTGEFMVITDVPQVRGSFLQTEANLLRFFQALRELEGLDIFPPEGPDGIPDLELSAGFGYVGESLGGITGSIGCSLAPEVKALVLNCMGGGFLNFGNDVVTSIVPQEQRLLWWSLAVLAMTAMDHLDPLSFTGLLAGSGDTGFPSRSVLMQAVVGDNAFDGAPTAVTARALGLDYVCPCPKEVPYLETVDAPFTGDGLYYYADTKHGFLLDKPANVAAGTAGRLQAAHFLKTALDGSEGEVVHFLP